MSAGKNNSKWRLIKGAAAISALAVPLLIGSPQIVQAGCAPPPFLTSAVATFGGLPGADISAQVARDESHNSLVGLWEDTYTDVNFNNPFLYQFEHYHSDQTEIEVDQSPILIGNVCLGTWTHLRGNVYGLVHPYLNFKDVNVNGEGDETTEGQPDGNSGYYACTITLDKGGNSFHSKCHGKSVVGVDPLDPNAAVIPGTEGDFGIIGKRISVNKNLLP
jgi:hypothetical protein